MICELREPLQDVKGIVFISIHIEMHVKGQNTYFQFRLINSIYFKSYEAIHVQFKTTVSIQTQKKPEILD